MTANYYIDLYFEALIQPFRSCYSNVFNISITGLACFIEPQDVVVKELMQRLEKARFHICIVNDMDSVCDLQVDYCDEANGKSACFEFQIVNLISIIELASRTDVSVSGLLVMKIVSKLICSYKIMYKAIVLDLDDTLWPGTLSEEGIDGIVSRLQSPEGTPFIAFMRFVRSMAKELGVFVAICSRNDSKQVNEAIERMDSAVFPLKDEIDCLVANNNDKSVNIKAIADKLSILTNAVVFIDDNPIVREEIRCNLPEVFVPKWESHEELSTLLNAGCIFERFELSVQSRKRRGQIKILQVMREKNNLPRLLIEAKDDPRHIRAQQLYAKSNQFKMMNRMNLPEDAQSIFFEIFRENGAGLGICSALTYSMDDSILVVHNCAISCRFFEIGLEEFILLYIHRLAGERKVYIHHEQTGQNLKAQELLKKYEELFARENGQECQFNESLIERLKNGTNLTIILS